MNKLLLLLLITTPVLASEVCITSNQEGKVLETETITTDVPNHLKGATIVVKLADGKVSEVPAELFKVVPRKQQRIITKVETSKVTSCKETLDNKNRVSLLGGYGAREGLNKDRSSTKVDIESKVGVVGGLQYQRSITERISVGVQGQTNQTGLLSVGYDF